VTYQRCKSHLAELLFEEIKKKNHLTSQ